jgi:GxxExxY protein
METDKLTKKIIGCVYTVHGQLGPCFLEKVYERALLIELKKAGLKVEAQVAINVIYDGVVIGDYFADILVENEIILELKAVQNLLKEHEIQLVHYLTATNKDIGLLINFGSKSAEIKRKYRIYKPRQD